MATAKVSIDVLEQLVLFTAADLDPVAELTWEEIHEGEEIPAYLKPRPLSNGVMDWCASTRNGGSVQVGASLR